MRITLRTRVQQPAERVFQQFDRPLLERLAPPFPVARLVRYDGQLPGHEVHIRLHFGLFTQTWHSRITPNRAEGPTEWFFEDVGTRLPFFLRAWTHRHIVRALPNGSSEIVDAVTFRSPWYTPAPLVWLALWGMFAYRQPIYRRVFRVQ
jgi:ligand-binding SRPBCC domain-containing protein